MTSTLTIPTKTSAGQSEITAVSDTTTHDNNCSGILQIFAKTLHQLILLIVPLAQDR